LAKKKDTPALILLGLMKNSGIAKAIDIFIYSG
jgi:hypothetical protein